MSEEKPPSSGPFRYHLELTPAQLKITHTALSALLDDFGYEESDVKEVIRQVLDKLPDQHAIRAIRLEDEIERELSERPGPSAPPEPDPGDEPGPSAA